MTAWQRCYYHHPHYRDEKTKLGRSNLVNGQNSNSGSVAPGSFPLTTVSLPKKDNRILYSHVLSLNSKSPRVKSQLSVCVPFLSSKDNRPAFLDILDCWKDLFLIAAEYSTTSVYCNLINYLLMVNQSDTEIVFSFLPLRWYNTHLTYVSLDTGGFVSTK